MKQKYIIAIVFVIIVTAISGGLLVGYSKKNLPMMSMDMSSKVSPVQTNKVMIEEGHKYSPDTISVKQGTTVTWTNIDADERHSVTVDGGEGPDSALLAKGQSYTYTFTKVGTVSYHCEVHPDMHGKVIVTN